MHIKSILLLLLGLLSTAPCNTTQVISQPGTYAFGNDSLYTPTGPNDPAIQVSASSVTLNFNNTTLSMDPTTSFTGNDAIVIDPGSQNIKIINGTLSGFSGAGTTIGDACSSILFDTIKIANCQKAGIWADGANFGIANLLCNNSVIVSCTGAQGGPAYGIYMNNVNGGGMFNSAVSLCDASLTNSGYGVYAKNSANFIINTCSFTGNGGAFEGVGVYGTNCNLCTIETSDISSNHASAINASARASGILFNSSTNCTYFNNRSFNNFSAGTATGIRLIGGSYNLVRECNASYNSGDVEGTGLMLESENRDLVLTSRIQHNQSSSGSAYGIHLNGSSNNQCDIEDNIMDVNIGASNGFGLVDDRNPSTSLFIKNRAFNNATNYSVSYSLGISLPVIVGSLSANLIGLPSGVGGALDNISVSP